VAGLSEADRATAVRLTERLAEAATTIDAKDAAKGAKPRVKRPPGDNPT
jgi:hypothetical protein